MLKKDIKKHLLRAKQLAEQNFGRVDKSEVLTEDLDILDKRIGHVRQACHNTHKKVQATLRDKENQDKEKRMKKIPEFQLAQQLIDASGVLGQDTLMGELFRHCGDAELNLSRHMVECEMEVEAKVLAPVHTLAEQEIPTIQKKKKQLEKQVLDMDSARNRYYSAVEKYKDQPGGTVKIDTAKDEMEDAQNRVDQFRDQLSTEMFSFAAKEADNSKFLINLIQIQAEYHEKALRALQEAIPRMYEVCDTNKQLPVYGTPIEDHLSRTNREIASVIEICVSILAEEAMQEEGLFRIAGGASKVKKVKAALDAGLIPDMNEIRDVHCIAGALKLYLRELPEPLMTFNLYNEWMQAAHLQHEEKMQQLWLLCDRLPKPNHNNLRYLIKFLAKLAEKAEVNKMSPSNIAIVIGPNLLWPKDAGQSVLTTSSQSSIVESLISHADYFFPGDMDFGITNASEKSTPPGTLNRPPTGLYPDLDPFLTADDGSKNSTSSQVPNHHKPLSTSNSSGNLSAEGTNQDVPSPRPGRRHGKKPAPLPPSISSNYNIERPAPGPPMDKTGSLERRSKPVPVDKPLIVTPTSEKHQFSGQQPDKPQPSPVDRPPIPDRPSLGPPPAPPKGQSPVDKDNPVYH